MVLERDIKPCDFTRFFRAQASVSSARFEVDWKQHHFGNLTYPLSSDAALGNDLLTLQSKQR